MRSRLAVQSRLALMLLLGTVCPAAARAQDAPPALGSRVRVWTRADDGTGRGGALVEGALSLWDGGMIEVTTAGQGRIVLPMDRVVRMQRSDGTNPRGRAALRGAGLGLLVGGAGGALLGLASGDDRNCSWYCFTAPEKAVLLGTVFGGGGALLGGTIGALAPGHRWRSVAVPGRVGVQAGRSGVGLAVSLRF